MAEDAQLITLAVRAHRHLGMTAANTGDVQLARDHIVDDLALVGRVGSPTLEVGVRGFQLLVDLMTDAWDEVLAGASSLLALSNRIGSARGVAMALAPQAIVLGLSRAGRGGGPHPR